MKTKGEARAEKKIKKLRAPTGSSFSGQAKRSQVNRGYQGVPRALKPKK